MHRAHPRAPVAVEPRAVGGDDRTAVQVQPPANVVHLAGDGPAPLKRNLLKAVLPGNGTDGTGRNPWVFDPPIDYHNASNAGECKRAIARMCEKLDGLGDAAPCTGQREPPGAGARA